ncbi:MAG: type I methionyl aminopeptidase [Oscillospiraceae bacterium]|nr:type I methionyl aminopeptidase [Oscillospiraceae bacterium]
MIEVKSEHEIELMREAGRITGLALTAVGAAIRPGIATKTLDDIAREVISKHNAFPSFLGYNNFPAAICVCVNEQLIHGAPGKRVLREGDIVSVDCGAKFEGFNGDSSCTWPVGRVSGDALRLIEVTRRCFYLAAEQVRPGARLSEVSRAIQTHAEQNGYNVVRRWTGHGVGRNLHEDPEVPCFVSPGRGPKLLAGMTLAIEPMVCAGGGEVKYASDRSTVVTCDGKLCAHYEHTVLVTETGFEILTAREDDESWSICPTRGAREAKGGVP